MELGAEYPDPYCPPMHRFTKKKLSLKEGKSGEEKLLKEKRPEPNQNDGNSKGENSKEESPKEQSSEEDAKGENSKENSKEQCWEEENGKEQNSKAKNANEMQFSSRHRTVRSESIFSSDGQQTRKRKSRSKDRSPVQTGNECVSNLKKRQKTSGQRKGRSAEDSEPGAQHASPPPLRKRLVRALRSMAETIYEDTEQVQAQQAGSLLPWEQLCTLRQLWGPLHTMMQTFYTMANQAAVTLPAQGWLEPAPTSAPQDLSQIESEGSSLEGERR